MLPFLKRDYKTQGIMIEDRKPDEKEQVKEETDSENDESDQDLKACAMDLIKAVHARDAKGVAEALRAAFQVADAEPHEEGPHVEPHSYDSQNQKASE